MVPRNTTAMHDVEYPPYSPSEVSELDDMERERERERKEIHTQNRFKCVSVLFLRASKKTSEESILERESEWRVTRQIDSGAKSILTPFFFPPYSPSRNKKHREARGRQERTKERIREGLHIHAHTRHGRANSAVSNRFSFLVLVLSMKYISEGHHRDTAHEREIERD